MRAKEGKGDFVTGASAVGRVWRGWVGGWLPNRREVLGLGVYGAMEMRWNAQPRIPVGCSGQR